jgi:thiamine biosynthesis lipoprotein
MGTGVTITVLHPDKAVAEAAVGDAFSEIERVEQLMSLYRPDSQLSILNRTGALEHPHPDVVRVLRAADDLWERTEGAFDVTVQPLWQLYSRCARQGLSPTEADLREAQAKIGCRQIHISPELIHLDQYGVQITLNGMAQGFAADAARHALEARGITHALIDAGEIGAVGQNLEKEKWRIGIKHPRNPSQFLGVARLQDRCLATSGDYETCFSDDFRENHLFDPRTGRSPSELASVSVAAPTAFEADALSTAVFILGPEKGRALVESVPETDALFVTKSGRVERTTGFPVHPLKPV